MRHFGLGVVLIFMAAYLEAASAKSQFIDSEKAACMLLKKRIATAEGFPISTIAFCDALPASASPHGLYVIALHSTRKCEGICSTLIGWFAVRKTTGEVGEFDINENRMTPLRRPR
jgi:hypothetical protein